MKHAHFPEVDGIDAQELGLQGAEKMQVKLLSENSVCLELEPGGNSPDHNHEDIERIVVMSGAGECKTQDGRKPLQPCDFVEFEADEQHQIINTGDKPLVLMCFRNQQ